MSWASRWRTQKRKHTFCYVLERKKSTDLRYIAQQTVACLVLCFVYKYVVDEIDDEEKRALSLRTHTQFVDSLLWCVFVWESELYRI